jgi:hypothetical protein
MADEQMMGAEADDVQFMRTVKKIHFDNFVYKYHFRKIIYA